MCSLPALDQVVLDMYIDLTWLTSALPAALAPYQEVFSANLTYTAFFHSLQELQVSGLKFYDQGTKTQKELQVSGLNPPTGVAGQWTENLLISGLNPPERVQGQWADPPHDRISKE